MKSFLLLASALLIVGGALAVFRPKAIRVIHPETKPSRATIESVTKNEGIVYGAISLAIGGGALFAAMSWNRWQVETNTKPTRNPDDSRLS
jgi:hypothetical protein